MIPRGLRRHRQPKTLRCAVCLYARKRPGQKVADLATTVLDGYAVCYDHLGVVAQGEKFHSILRTARGEP